MVEVGAVGLGLETMIGLIAEKLRKNRRASKGKCPHIDIGALEEV